MAKTKTNKNGVNRGFEGKRWPPPTNQMDNKDKMPAPTLQRPIESVPWQAVDKRHNNIDSTVNQVCAHTGQSRTHHNEI